MLTDPNFLFGLVGALGVLAPGIIAIWRWCRRMSRQWGSFLEDWQGEAARPGVPPRLGVMERLAEVEQCTQQLRPNGGSHLADRIEAIATDQVTKHERLDRIEQALSRMAGTQDHIMQSMRDGDCRCDRVARAIDAYPERLESVSDRTC